MLKLDTAQKMKSGSRSPRKRYVNMQLLQNTVYLFVIVYISSIILFCGGEVGVQY